MTTSPLTPFPEAAAFWNAAADSFDEEPDHGLRDPAVREAWRARLASWLPAPPSSVLDVGCGTGSLALLLAEEGHTVTGVDLSPRMAELARKKLAGRAAQVIVGDAADPPVGDTRFDVLLCRHVVWNLPDPHAALRRWRELVRPGGRLVLVEGRWGTGSVEGMPVEGMPWAGGVRADTLARAVRDLVAELRVEPLPDPRLWGKEIDDERYALIATV
ncbi:class I SAM-dependent methyltransferase [Nonomuraea sp. NPDC059194]|uniref:class I SAM-dependent methyltransferase n=1 Tax=Nonomuraea sp. NPDC059194 TaxID=3346764 RepID=UPI0036C11236